MVGFDFNEADMSFTLIFFLSVTQKEDSSEQDSLFEPLKSSRFS